MKNAGNQGRRRKTALQLGLSAVILVLVAGLSAGAGRLLPSPPPQPSASERGQSALAARTRDLAARAESLSAAGSDSGRTAPLARLLATQAKAFDVPGVGSAPASPSVTASRTPTQSGDPSSAEAALADDTLASVRELLAQAGHEPQGGLARLYTSAALARLDALRPLWAGRAPSDLTAQSVTQAVTVPQSGCVTASGAPSSPGTTTAASPAAGTPAASSMSGAAATATRAVLRSAAYTTYLYQVVLARHDPAAQAPDSASFQELGKTSRDARAWLAAACQDQGLTEPGYLLPDGISTAPGKALGTADAGLAQAALDLVASAGPGEREWAIRLFLDSAERAHQWGVPLGGSSALPGLQAPMDTATTPATPQPSSTR